MAHLIDKDALVAEIEKVEDELAPSHDQQCPWEDGYYCGLYKAESIIDTLEVKKVQEEPVSEDLEEAATTFADVHVYATRKICFKAGAKWMAELGVSFEYIVEDKALELGYGKLVGIDPIINLPESFNIGDKVIVQIRKEEA